MDMPRDYFKRVQTQTPTRYWINNPTREQAEEAIDCGAVGCTLNPAYMSKLLEIPGERERVLEKIRALTKTEPDDTAVAEKLQTELVIEIAGLFLPIFEATGGRQGMVSIQGDPFNETSEHIIAYGRHNASRSPNIIPKIPVVPEGLEAIEALSTQGISINSTEIFAMAQFIDVAEIHRKATAGKVAPPTLFYSHIIGIFDEYLQRYADERRVEVSPDALWQAGAAVAKKMEALRVEREYRVRMISGGARGLQHFTEMVGAESCVTINWIGTSDKLLEQNPPVVQRFLQPTPHSVLDELREKLPDFRRAYDLHGLTPEEYEEFGPVQLFLSSFQSGWKAVLKEIDRCRRAS